MKIREEIKDFKPYTVLEDNYHIRLDKNENPFPLPKDLKEKLFNKLKTVSLNRYGPIDNKELRIKLAQFWRTKENLSFLGKEHVIIGNGSDELILLLMKLFRGDHIIINPPTYSLYRFYGELEGIDIVKVVRDKKFRLQNIKQYLDNAKAIFICAPHNPSGTLPNWDKVIELLETGVPVILDEAYGEFANETKINLVKKYKNLVVLKTFSKAFGLAGIRVGYAIAQPQIIDHLLRIKSPYNISVLSSRIAKCLLENYDIVQKRINFIINERERIREEFKKYTYPSQANFLLFDLNAYNFLLKRGIVVRTFTGRLKDKIRITIGNKKENDTVINSLYEYIKQK